MKIYRVMTFNLKNDTFFTRKNLRWDTRKRYVENLIRATRPQIIGVQELNSEMRRQLEVMLPQYQFVGKARNRVSQFMNEHSDILFLKTDFDLVYEKTFWLSKQPEQAGSRSWTSIFPRICTMAELRDKQSGTLLRIFNTHLDHLLSVSRNFEISIILQQLKMRHSLRPCPFILMGDLNTTDQSPTIQQLIAPDNPYRMKTVYDSEAVFNTLHFGKGKLKDKQRPIDYIFVSQDFDVVSSRIITTCFNGLYPSDHYPVICQLELKEGENKK